MSNTANKYVLNLKRQASLTINQQEAEQMMHSNPLPNALCWAKDLRSRYLFCNENHAQAAGVDSPKQMLRKNDFDFCWSNRADFYQHTDNLVREGTLLYANEPEKVKTLSLENTMLVTKYRVVDVNDECVGVVGLNIDIGGYCLIKKVGHYDQEKQIFYLGHNCKNEYLTKRELDVLKLLMLGYTAKRIGRILNISYRTVEGYINILRYKLKCESKCEIMATAIKLGLAFLLLEMSDDPKGSSLDL